MIKILVVHIGCVIDGLRKWIYDSEYCFLKRDKALVIRWIFFVAFHIKFIENEDKDLVIRWIFFVTFHIYSIENELWKGMD